MMTMTQIYADSYSWSFSKEPERKLMSMLATRIALRIGGSSMVHGTGGSHMELGCSARLGQDTAFQLSRGTERSTVGMPLQKPPFHQLDLARKVSIPW